MLDHYQIDRPLGVQTDDDIRPHLGSLFLLTSLNRDFALRGQFLVVDGEAGQLVFVGSPWLAWISRNVPEKSLQLDDFAPSDAQLDQLFYMSTEEELFAGTWGPELSVLEPEAAKALGADSLTYLPVSDLDRAFGGPRCAACFDGQYPQPLEAAARATIAKDRRRGRPPGSSRPY